MRYSTKSPVNIGAVFCACCLGATSCAAFGSSASEFSSELKPARPTAIHPTSREVASPAGGCSVSVNPPPLLWPIRSGRDVRYTVRLSQDAKFLPGATISAKALPWAMFNAHTKLATGAWRWQFGTIRRGEDRPKWSPVFHFRVEQSARVFVTPPAENIIAACPKDHPRILANASELGELRERMKGTDELPRILEAADRYVGLALPNESDAKPSEEGRNPYETKNFAKWASKGFAAKTLGPIRELTRAYLFTGNERYGREAVKRGLFVASLDPDGATARRVSDFADGSCMEAMALVYDTCYELLSEEERSFMRASMQARAGRFFDRCMNDLESRVFSAHIWQHILIQGTDVAIALLGEVPEAETWLSYVYEIWIARVPLLGGEDGGWANGTNYFGTNFHTLLEMPSMFGRMANVDFFAHPWYRNAPYLQIYCWPPNSASDGFGDGGERGSPPSTSRGTFVAKLGERFRDPYALWYAEQVLGRQYVSASTSTAALPEPKSPADLPQARAFRDIGVVSMHTDLADSMGDLMIGFRSSPYGSYNHMHSDQNSFNINFGGKRLFANSGYYIAYGDDHFKDWYTHTRGHNSVLIDNRGQVRGAHGYGWIARFLHGRQISYCLGDASAAYGDAGLTRFRRHLVLLRPSIVGIYDELEADHAADWSWLLHSDHKTATEGNRISVSSDAARSQVVLFGSSPLVMSVDTRFDSPAVNWRNRKSGGKTIEYPDQWHATAGPAARVSRLRVLAIMQIRSSDETTPFAQVVAKDGGRLDVGDWRIQAEMTAARPASLTIERTDGKVLLAVDRPNATIGAKRYDLPPGTSFLAESEGEIVQQCQDELPAAAR